jgi:ribosome biogenesis GTPase
MISSGIEKLGFEKWFQDNVDPLDLNRFDIARVMAVHKDSYIINDGENDVFAELIGKMLFSAASPIDFPAVGDWVLAS